MGLVSRYKNTILGTVEVVNDPLPAGLFFALPYGSRIPDGMLACDGTPVRKSKYPELHKRLTTAYGTDDGINVKLPDLRGRAIVGVGTHADVAARGLSDGLAVGSRTPRHAHATVAHTHAGITHDHSSPSHTHTAESHEHAIATHAHSSDPHAHGVSGSLANTAGKPGASGTNTVSDNTHNHGAGSYVMDSTTPAATGSTAPGSSGAGSSSGHSATTPANTDPAAATSGSTVGDNVQPATTLGFMAIQWVITTGRTRTRRGAA